MIYAIRLVHHGVVEYAYRKKGFLKFSKELEICFDTIRSQFKEFNHSRQPSTLTDIIQTLQKKELILLASCPAIGKTALSVRLIEEMLSIMDLPIVIFSLEYSVQTMAGKFVTSSKVNNFDKLKSGQLNEIIWRNFPKKSQSLAQKIFIDDRRGLQPQQLIETCEIVANQYQGKIGIIVTRSENTN